MQLSIDKMVPVGKRCLVQPLKREGVSVSGLIMPEDANNPTPVAGTVIKAGTASVYKEGDFVFFRRFSVDEIKFSTASGEMVVNLVEDDEVVATYEK